MRVLIDGQAVDAAEAAISVFDHGLLRGDGCFEALRSYRGSPFALGPHLDRLAASAALLHLDLPSHEEMEGWIRAIARDGGDCTVRIVATRGGFDPDVNAAPRVVVLWEPIPELPEHLCVLPLEAPWHPDGATSELTGAKTLSYAPNMAANRVARLAGFDDALLHGRSGRILEGPTFCVAWVVDGVLETPSLDLGILASITRGATLQEAAHAGIGVREGHFGLDRLDDADEVMALSTVKEVKPIVRVGERRFVPGSVTELLARRYGHRVETALANG